MCERFRWGGSGCSLVVEEGFLIVEEFGSCVWKCVMDPTSSDTDQGVYGQGRLTRAVREVNGKVSRRRRVVVIAQDSGSRARTGRCGVGVVRVFWCDETNSSVVMMIANGEGSKLARRSGQVNMDNGCTEQRSIVLFS